MTPARRSALILLFACLAWLVPGLRDGLAQAPQGELWEAPHTAFYYGPQPPVELLMQFDRVVVEPAQLSAPQRAAISHHGAQLYAYLSVGEAEPWRKDYADFDPAWRLGRNDNWNTDVADLTRSGWRDLLRRRVARLWADGYRGFFLDALDSWLPHTRGEGRAAQAEALTGFIVELKRDYPEISLIANRGFEVLDRVAPLLDGLVAESLYGGYLPRRDGYRDVPAADREWLLSRLSAAHEQHGLPVTVIDYLPLARRDEADALIRRIEAHGFRAWVASGRHTTLGRGSLRPQPRRVLMLYDGRNADGSLRDIADSRVHRLLAMPLEYMGYVPEYVDIRHGLPQGPLADRYAGAVSWFDRHPPPVLGLRRWILRQLEDRLPLAVFGQWGIPHDAALRRATGLPPYTDSVATVRRVAARDALIGFEGEPSLIARQLGGYRADDDEQLAAHSPHLLLEGVDGRRAAGVVSGPWGGVALDPWILYEDYRGRTQWVLDPFTFLRRALHLAQIPAPDATTENGRRVLLAHIDGDGFASLAQRPGSPYAAAVIASDILDRYRIPHSVSVVEGEIATLRFDRAVAKGQNEIAALEALAGEILRRPLVEPASHTYSHPFRWGQLVEGEPPPAGAALDLPGYRVDYRREIEGSLAYIDRLIGAAPRSDGRPSTELLLLSGDCRPDEHALAAIDRVGALAVNGGENEVYADFASVSQLSPMVRQLGEYEQVYAPLTNENAYTDGWQPPYDGFRRVLHTLEFSERPRRLKPIDIYYHFYSGSQPAALAALREVYDWAMAQENHPKYLSDYARAALEFRRIGIARLLDSDSQVAGGAAPVSRWRISGATELRSLRLAAGLRPDMAASRGLAGYRCLHDGCRAHLGGDTRVELALRGGAAGAATESTAAELPALHHSNGRVDYWRQTPQGADFRLRATVPLRAEFHTAGRSCQLLRNGRPLPVMRRGGLLQLQLSREESGDVALRCD